MKNDHAIFDESPPARLHALDLAARGVPGGGWKRRIRVFHYPGRGVYSVSTASEDCEDGMRRIVARYPCDRSRNL